MDKSNRPFFSNLKCRECGKLYDKKAIHVCEFDFGPLEAAYDYDAIKASISRSVIESRPKSMWRYRELLPIDGEPTVGKPALLVLNKIDKIHEKRELLPLIDWYRQEYQFEEIIPLSALKGEAIDDLLDSIVKHLPEGEPLFDDDELTDQPLRMIVAEMVREKILSTTGEEIPYVTAVVTEKWDDEDPEITEIYCAIYVERSSQKSIIIGKGGSRVKDIGTAARMDIEQLLGKRVFLKLFVKVVEERILDVGEHARSFETLGEKAGQRGFPDADRSLDRDVTEWKSRHCRREG